jgi:hypothetical protein
MPCLLIDKVLRDIEESTVRSESTTELGNLINLRLQTLDQQAMVLVKRLDLVSWRISERNFTLGVYRP